MNPPESKVGDGDSSHAKRIAELHADCSAQLNKLACAILRDWELAADAVQETFKLLAQKIASIDESHLQGWLVKTVQFQALNMRRGQNRARKLVQRIREESTPYTTSAATMNDLDETADKVEVLRQAIEDLPAEQRQIVHRRMVLEQGFADIARELQLPLGTVLSRMRLAVDKLRKRLADEP